MGQIASNEENNDSSKLLVLELFTKEQILKFFQLRCVNLLSKDELSSLASRLNVTSANDPDTAISYSDVAYVLQLSNDKEQDILEVHESFVSAVKFLTRVLGALGTLPFLQDSLRETDEPLTLRKMVIASTVLLGRIRRMLGSKYNYLKLLFLAFSVASGTLSASLSEKNESDPEKSDVANGDDQFVVEAVKIPSHLENDQDDFETSRRIKWDSFGNIKSYDEIDVKQHSMKASDLLNLLTLLLIVSSVPKKSHIEMQAHIQKNINEKWIEFEDCALTLVRYFDIEIEKLNVRSRSISFEQFSSACQEGIGRFIIDKLAKLVERSILSPIVSDGKITKKEEKEEEEETHQEYLYLKLSPKKSAKKHKFEETRLINEPSISLIALALRNAGSNVKIGTSNLIQLYNGSQSGFSVRSLELKIFKWHAPTIFLVSGKRLKQKTISTNRRYQQFDQEYPRYFLSNENSQRDWQKDLDRLTYAVFVHLPWRSSNKKNFGDEESVIISLLPRFDFHKTKPDPVLQGRLIYFSNLGMGVGFGNDQPVNKNTVRKYLPGNVSLTIEANLEFAVFRHIRSAGPNTTNYFEKSSQRSIEDEDFEDRFMITDLEVWGVGSNKELDEQRKQWEWEEKQAKARQSVNIRNTGEERAFLEMAGLVGNHGAGGSV